MTPNETLRIVEEFHALFRYCHPSPIEPSVRDVATNLLRVELIREELEELIQAHNDNSALGILDALCDLQYVLSGAVLALGFKSVYHDAVAQKYREVPSKDYVIERMDSMLLACRIFRVQFYNFDSNLRAKNPSGVLRCLAAMQFCLDRMIRLTHFTAQFDDAFREVHRANMAKVFTRTQLEDYKSTGADFFFEHSGAEDMFIVRRPDGKILKPLDHSPAKLECFV